MDTGPTMIHPNSSSGNMRLLDWEMVRLGSGSSTVHLVKHGSNGTSRIRAGPRRGTIMNYNVAVLKMWIGTIV